MYYSPFILTKKADDQALYRDLEIKRILIVGQLALNGKTESVLTA